MDDGGRQPGGLSYGAMPVTSGSAVPRRQPGRRCIAQVPCAAMGQRASILVRVIGATLRKSLQARCRPALPGNPSLRAGGVNVSKNLIKLVIYEH
jgi:hypothetical protein